VPKRVHDEVSKGGKRPDRRIVDPKSNPPISLTAEPGIGKRPAVARPEAAGEKGKEW